MHAVESFFISVYVSQVLGLAPFRIKKMANKINFEKCPILFIYSTILAIFIFGILLRFMSIVWEKGGVGIIIMQQVLISKWLPLFLDYFLSLTTSGFTAFFIVINLNSILEALNKFVTISRKILLPKQIRMLRNANLAMIASGFIIHVSMTLTIFLANPFKTSKILFSTGFIFLSEVVPIAYICQFSSYVVLIGCYYSAMKNYLIVVKERRRIYYRCVDSLC